MLVTTPPDCRRLGDHHVAVRQYAGRDDETPLTRSERIDRAVRRQSEDSSDQRSQLTGHIEELASKYRAMTEDIAVTEPFIPEDTHGTGAARETQIQVPEQRGKLGFKLRERAHSPDDDESFLNALAPTLTDLGVDLDTVQTWLRDSSVIPHAVSNIQLGSNFVTLYRHPSSFGWIDVENRKHAKLALQAARSIAKNDRRRRKLDSVRPYPWNVPEREETDETPNTDCEDAIDTFWSAQIFECEDTNGVTCSDDCIESIDDLIDDCDDCALVYTACDSEPVC